MNIFEILGPVSSNLLHSTLLYNALPCFTLPYFALLFCAIRCYLLCTFPTPLPFCSAPLFSAGSTLLSHALLYPTLLISTLLRSTSLYSIYSADSSLFLILCPTLLCRLCFTLFNCDLHCSALLYHGVALICFVLLYSTLHESTLFYSRFLISQEQLPCQAGYHQPGTYLQGWHCRNYRAR